MHTGHSRAFVYDMADLYKAEVTIPLAFDVVAEGSLYVAGDTRRRVRDALRSGDILARCVKDIKRLLLPSDNLDFDVDIVRLWDDRQGALAGGVDYSAVDF